MSIIVLIPAYNEEDGIGPTIRRTVTMLEKLGVRGELLVIDDGSIDDTLRITESMDVPVISMEHNMGKGAALKKAIHSIRTPVIATVDADGSYPVERIPDMLHVMVTTPADMVIGSRFLGTIQGGMPFLNKLGNIWFSWLISVLTGVKVTDASSGLRVFKRELVEHLNVQADGLDFEVELTTRAVYNKYSVVEVPITYAERIGQSKLKPMKDGWKFFKGILRGRFV